MRREDEVTFAKGLAVRGGGHGGDDKDAPLPLSRA